MTWGRKIRWPQAAAHRLGLQIHALNAQQRTSGREGFHGACGPQGRGLVVNPDRLSLNLRQKIVTAVAHQRVAAVYYSRDYAVVGGLIATGQALQTSTAKGATTSAAFSKGTSQATCLCCSPLNSSW